ncbi:MAG: hypothetical protein M1837_007184 [Sclerophora amabilis]|nr:MAG: hypothetical protein M1837_007184 [Sclerophora amabilis]
MEETSFEDLLDQLDDHIDGLEETLAPLIKTTRRLSDRAAKLPLLDKAKLYVLTSYAIESILFSYLRLNQVDAKTHPVFRELARVKQYFEKLQNAETTTTSSGGQTTKQQHQGEKNLSLDKPAAGRFIKHALAGNEKHDLERAEREAKEKARALLKARQIAAGQKRAVEKSEEEEEEEEEDSSDDDDDDDDDEDDDDNAEGAGPSSSASGPSNHSNNHNNNNIKTKKKKRQNLETTESTTPSERSRYETNKKEEDRGYDPSQNPVKGEKNGKSPASGGEPGRRVPSEKRPPPPRRMSRKTRKRMKTESGVVT